MLDVPCTRGRPRLGDRTATETYTASQAARSTHNNLCPPDGSTPADARKTGVCKGLVGALVVRPLQSPHQLGVSRLRPPSTGGVRGWLLDGRLGWFVSKERMSGGYDQPNPRGVQSTYERASRYLRNTNRTIASLSRGGMFLEERGVRAGAHSAVRSTFTSAFEALRSDLMAATEQDGVDVLLRFLDPASTQGADVDSYRAWPTYIFASTFEHERVQVPLARNTDVHLLYLDQGTDERDDRRDVLVVPDVSEVDPDKFPDGFETTEQGYRGLVTAALRTGLEPNDPHGASGTPDVGAFFTIRTVEPLPAPSMTDALQQIRLITDHLTTTLIWYREQTRRAPATLVDSSSPGV